MEEKQQTIAKEVITNGQIHSQSFETNSIFLKTTENAENISITRLKSVDNLILLTFAKYQSLTGLIVFKELILIAYNMNSKRENTFVLNIPDIKITNKNFNINRIIFVSLTKIASNQFIALIILLNFIFIISIEEDTTTNELSHKIIYKDKTTNNRYLIVGSESFENIEIFSLLSKPNNTLINITCTLNVINGEIKVDSIEKQLDKSKYQFDRYTQSACNWILFTEKNANKNIMIDKNTLKIYSLNCKNDLLNHSFFLMQNDDQLNLVTDIEENKKVSVHLFKLILNNNEQQFDSEIVEIYDVACDNYEKYVFNALNDRCFFVNFYNTFVAYFYNSQNKVFDKSYRFSIDKCELVQVFNYNCFNDNEDKTHLVIETYKDKKLILMDYQLKERVLENNQKTKKEFNSDVNITEEKIMNALSDYQTGQNDKEMVGIENYNPLKVEAQSIKNKEKINQNEKKPIKNQSKETLYQDKYGNQKQFNQIEQKVDEIIESHIDSISYKLMSKYKNILKNLEIQTKKIEQKQNQFDKCLDGLMKSIKNKEDQISNQINQNNKTDDSNCNIENAPKSQTEENKGTVSYTNKLSTSNSPLVIEQHNKNKESNSNPLLSYFNSKGNANESIMDNNMNNQIPSYFPKQFQSPNVNVTQNQGKNQANPLSFNPQIMTLMMNLMGPINQMYSMLLNTVLQNQKNILYQNRQGQNQSNQQTNYPPNFSQTTLNTQSIYSPNQNLSLQQSEQHNHLSIYPNKKPEDKTIELLSTKEERPQNDKNTYNQKKKHQNSKKEDDDFKEVVKKKKSSKKAKMKKNNDFKNTNPYQIPNENIEESNDNNSNNHDCE